MIQPALTPLHPEKPLREIVAGETWTKRASQKCINKRPTFRVITFNNGIITGVVSGLSKHIRRTERTFRRDWE